MRRIQIITVIALILAALIFAYSQAPQSTTRPEQTATEAKRDQVVKAKKVLVKELPKGLEGIVLKDGVFKLKPGYKFVNQTANTVSVALVSAAGGVTGSFNCSCNAKKEGEGASGTCSVTTTKSGVTCYKDDKDTCNGECLMATVIRGQRWSLAIY